MVLLLWEGSKEKCKQILESAPLLSEEYIGNPGSSQGDFITELTWVQPGALPGWSAAEHSEVCLSSETEPSGQRALAIPTPQRWTSEFCVSGRRSRL